MIWRARFGNRFGKSSCTYTSREGKGRSPPPHPHLFLQTRFDTTSSYKLEPRWRTPKDKRMLTVPWMAVSTTYVRATGYTGTAEETFPNIRPFRGTGCDNRDNLFGCSPHTPDWLVAPSPSCSLPLSRFAFEASHTCVRPMLHARLPLALALPELTPVFLRRGRQVAREPSCRRRCGRRRKGRGQPGGRCHEGGPDRACAQPRK